MIKLFGSYAYTNVSDSGFGNSTILIKELPHNSAGIRDLQLKTVALSNYSNLMVMWYWDMKKPDQP